jgi:hypothetical protein
LHIFYKFHSFFKTKTLTFAKNKINMIKQLKSILIASAVTIGSFATIVSCNPDPCQDVVCKNNASCLDGVCMCPLGFEGNDCSTQSISKFLGNNNSSINYNFLDSSSVSACNKANGTGFDGIFTMVRSSADTTRVIISNFGGFGPSISIYATANGNKLTIPSQAVTGASFITVVGSGTISGNTITGLYNSNDGSSVCDYNFKWTKQ